MLIEKIISGGQTGVDRAALDAAISNRVQHGGWCPRGRLAEDGVIDGCYILEETSSMDYAVRTRLNVRDSDGTLILKTGRLEGGTALTAKLAGSLDKPMLIMDVDQPLPRGQIDDWITSHNIKVMNIAGPRESKQPGIYRKAYDLLDQLLKNKHGVTEDTKGI